MPPGPKSGPSGALPEVSRGEDSDRRSLELLHRQNSQSHSVSDVYFPSPNDLAHYPPGTARKSKFLSVSVSVASIAGTPGPPRPPRPPRVCAGFYGGAVAFARRLFYSSTRSVVATPTPVTPDHIEALATWKGQPSDEAADWFRRAGFSVQAGRSGLFLSAAATTAVSAFGLAGAELQGGVTLPVPSELQLHIASITVLRPRQYL